MLKKLSFLALTLVVAASAALAGAITLDMNGFPNIAGGQVTGPGLDKPIPMPPKQQQVTLDGLQAGATYGVDFFHDSGPLSSDFMFTMNDAGTGVAKVTPSEPTFTLLDGFQANATTLKIKTFPIVFNANKGQTGVYFIQGLSVAYQTPADGTPQKYTAMPGYYPVDMLYNTGGGNEDFAFVVNDKGEVGAVDSLLVVNKDESRKKDANEYAIFEKNEVQPRFTLVHFHIEASDAISFHASHRVLNFTANAPVYDLDLPMTVGSGGLNVWSFGKFEVTGGDASLWNGKPTVGVKGDNDYHFEPVLRYDQEKKVYYFETNHGKDTTVKGEAKGFFDGNEKELTVKVTATIVPEKEKPAEVVK